MVDSLQAVERAQAILDELLQDSGHGHWADVECCPSFECRLATATRALAAALADTERERDALRESEAEWQRRGDRAIAAEARVAELEAALRRIEGYCGDNWRFEQVKEFASHALKALAAHPSGCAKPGGEQ